MGLGKTMSLSQVYIKRTIVKTPTLASEILEWGARLFEPSAYYLLLATDRVEFRPFSAFDHNLVGVYSLALCDAQTELWLEKGPFESAAKYRLLQERAASEEGFKAVFQRISAYVPRQKISPNPKSHAIIEPPGGSARLIYKEYFSPDGDGWLTLTDARLAGLNTGGL
jgi:hypothetical protein